MRAGRWRHKAPDPAADHAAARGARPDLGGHLLLYAVVERVHLRARLHPEQRQQDRPRGDPDRTRLRRRLSMGRADGGLAARLAAGRGVLLAVRRLLRLVTDRRGEGIDFKVEHDLRANAPRVCREGKPVPTFPDHALFLARAVIAEGGVALVELRLDAGAVAAER